MGQVDDVHAHYSSVLLLSDPDHALPVQLARTGLRTVAYGTGQTGYLDLPNVPLHADVREGDLFVTSGLGDRFPAGFPVAEVVSVDRDTGGAFALVKARPLAALDKGREVLLVVPESVEQVEPETQVTEEPGVDEETPEAEGQGT
jgi:rod shape-determining protein MreC